MNEKQYTMGSRAGQIANPAPKNKINTQTAQEKTQYGSDFTGYTYTDGKTGQQFQFTSQAADWMRRAYQSQFDSYYAKDAADQASKASGAMPRSFVQSYTKSKADQQLYEMGLPSAKWLGKYLGDYETWRGDGKVVDLDGNPDAKKYVQDQWKKTWKYSGSLEDMRRQQEGRMPEALEEKYFAKGGKQFGLTKSFASQYYLEHGLPDADELGGFLASYGEWSGKKSRIDAFYDAVSARAIQAEMRDGVRDDDGTYEVRRRYFTKDGKEYDPNELEEWSVNGAYGTGAVPRKYDYDKVKGSDYYTNLFYEMLDDPEWSDVKAFLAAPKKAAKEIKEEDYATYADYQAALIKAQEPAAPKKGEPDPNDPYALSVSAEGWREFYGADKTGWRATISAMQAADVFRMDKAAAEAYGITGTFSDYMKQAQQAGLDERDARIVYDNYTAITQARGKRKKIADAVGTLIGASLSPIAIVKALADAGYTAKDLEWAKDAILSANPDDPAVAKAVTDAISEARAGTGTAAPAGEVPAEKPAPELGDFDRTKDLSQFFGEDGKLDPKNAANAVMFANEGYENMYPGASLTDRVKNAAEMLKQNGIDAAAAYRAIRSVMPEVDDSNEIEWIDDATGGRTGAQVIASIYGTNVAEVTTPADVSARQASYDLASAEEDYVKGIFAFAGEEGARSTFDSFMARNKDNGNDEYANTVGAINWLLRCGVSKELALKAVGDRTLESGGSTVRVGDLVESIYEGFDPESMQYWEPWQRELYEKANEANAIGEKWNAWFNTPSAAGQKTNGEEFRERFIGSNGLLKNQNYAMQWVYDHMDGTDDERIGGALEMVRSAGIGREDAFAIAAYTFGKYGDALENPDGKAASELNALLDGVYGKRHSRGWSLESWLTKNLPDPDQLEKQKTLSRFPEAVELFDSVLENNGGWIADSEYPTTDMLLDVLDWAYSDYDDLCIRVDTTQEDLVGEYIRRAYDKGEIDDQQYSALMTRLYDEMQSRRGDLYQDVAAIFREHASEAGMNPFQFDNALRRIDQDGTLLDDDTAARDYFIWGGGGLAMLGEEDHRLFSTMSPEKQEEFLTKVWDEGMTDEMRAAYVAEFTDTAAYNPAVDKSVGTNVTSWLMGRGFAKVMLGLLSGGTSFVNMVTGLIARPVYDGDESKDGPFTEWVRTAYEQVSNLNVSRDDQSAASHWTNIGMTITEELARMYIEHGLGTMVANKMGWAGRTFGSGEGLSRVVNWSAHKLLKDGAAIPFIANAMGNYYTEARQAGESALASTMYAIPMGLFEGVTESWNTDEWFAKGLGGKKFAARLIGDSKLFAKTGTKGMLVLNSLLSSFAGEAVEEGASNFLGWVHKGIYWSGHFTENKFDPSEMLQEALMGGLTGLIGSAMAAPSTSVQSSMLSFLEDSPEYRDSIMDLYYHDRVYGPISEEQRAAYRARGMAVLNDEQYSAAQHDLFQARTNVTKALNTYNQTVSYEQGKLDRARSVEQAKQAAWDALEQNRADTPEWQAEFAKATQALATARNDAQKAQSDFDAHVAAAWDTYTASRTQNERAAAKAQDRLNAHSVYLRDLMYSRMESLPAYTRSAENARNAEGIRSQAEQTLNANADTIADVSFGDIDAASENIMATAELNRNRDALRLKWEDAMREIDEIRRAAGAGTLEQYLAGREDMRAQAEEVLRLAWGSDNLGADMQWAMDFVRAEQLYAADRAAGMDDAQARANYDMRVRAADVGLNDRIRAGNRAEQTAKQPTGRPLTGEEWNKTLKSMTAQYTKAALTNGTEQMGQAFEAYKQAVRSGRDVYTTVRLNEVLYDAKNGKAYEAPMTEEQAQAARANTETESAPAETTGARTAETTEAPAAQASETQAAPETQAAQPAASDAVSEIERTPVSEEAKAEIQAFAKKLGRTVVFEDMEDNDSNGYCDANDVIHLNTAQEEHAPDSKDFFKHGVGIVLFHELTHTLEGSKSYGELQDFLLGRGGEHGYIYERAGARGYRESWEAIRGIVLSTPGNENLKGAALDELVRKEMVAYYLQDVVNTQEFADHLASRKWNLAARIKDWARHQIYKAGFNQGKLGRTEYAAKRALENIEYLYTKALLQNGRKGADGMREHAYGQNLKPYSEAKRASHSNFSMQEAVASYNGAVTTDTDADVSEQDEAPFQMLEGGTLAARYSNGTWTERDKARLHGEVVAGMENVLRKQDEVVDEARHQQIVEAVQKYINDINSVSARIFANEATLDYTANPDMRVSMLKPNNEYEVTVDASTLCPKRLLYQGTFDAIQKELPNTPLMPDDLIDLVNMMKKRGYVAPCGICYVESRRRWLDKFANDWLSGYTNSSGEWVPPYKGVEGDPYIPTIAELTSSEGYAKLYDTHRPTYYAFADAMNKKGTSNPKVVQMRTEYRNEIAGYTENFVKKLKGIGGIRIQSFSDFEIIHMIDMMQAVMDMAAKGLTAQAYTKVPEFAWIFGGTGIKINLSLIGEGNGLDANGNLIFSSVEGMDFRTAMALRRRYSANVGTILVGINDDHIVAAMGDDRIDFIIPFHKSGWSQEELNKMPELNSYSDYTDYQNERLIVFGKDGKPLRVKNNKKGDNKKAGWYESKSLKDAGLKNYNPVGDGGYWDFEKSGTENAEHYLEMCARDHRLPKFWQFLVDNNDGSFSLPKGDDERSTKIRNGYWKTLTDFKMYDNNGAGAAQRAVLPEFNMAWANKILDDYVKRGGYSMGTDNVTGNEIIYNPAQGDLPVAKDVVDDFVAAYKAAHPGRRYSRGSFSMQEYLQDGYTAQRDRAYAEVVAAAESGDKAALETAQKMVDDSARENGYTIKVYRGDTERHDVFDTSLGSGKTQYGAGTYFTDGYGIAESWAIERSKQINDGKAFVGEYYINGSDMFHDRDIADDDPHWANVENILREYGANEKDIHVAKIWGFKGIASLLVKLGKAPYTDGPYAGDSWKNSPVVNALLREAGYKGIIGPFMDMNQYVLFDPSLAKSADPITRDKDGNIIPLSKRFDAGNADNRYSRGSFSFDEALKRYRPIEQGMDPRARDIQVPSQASDDTKNSKFYRSFLESHHLPDSWIPAAKEAMQDFAYEPIANDEMADRARDEIARDGGLTYAREKVKAQIEGGQVTALNNAKALQLIAESSERGDYAEAIDLAATLAAAATEAGRAVQIFATLKKMGGAGAAAYWAKIVQRLNVQYDRFIRSGRMQALDLNSPELAPLVQDLTNARTRYEVGVAEDALTKQIGQMLPLTFSEKLRNWRYFAMLANPVTHARNFTGNVLMYGMRGLKDVVASGLETGAQAFGMIDRGDRAHSLSRKDRDAFRAIAKRSYENNSAEIEGENRYAFDVGINRNKRAFQNRLLNRAATFNSDLLGKEDVLFLRWNYFDAYAEYCAGQGFDPDHMSAAERAEAHQFAMDQAQKATFHDASALASWLNKTPAGARLFVEAVMPFKKTPINIAKRGIEYSPAGIVKGIVQAIDVARGAKGSGKYTAAQAIDSLASGFTGSALAALGYFLAKCGLLRAAGEDKEYEEFLEATGSEQTHSLHLDIGGTELSISLAQFAPAMMPMLMGAAWYESASDTGEHLEFGDILDIMSGITNPMMEMSFLSSLNEALKNYSYGKDDSTIGGQIGTVLLTAGKNYVSQFLPTFGQKIADMADPTSRSASGDKTSPLGAQDYYPRQLAKKVPGATYALEPNIDVHGDVVRRDGFWDWALAFANDFVLPGKVKVKERDAVDEALIDIYWATGNTSILPTLPTTKYLQWTVKGEKHKVDMNASQFTQYKSDVGTAYYAAIKEEMRAFDWDRLTDEVKADRIEDALKAAKKQVDSLWKEMLGSTVA